MTIKEFKDFLIERKYKKYSANEYSYIDTNKHTIQIKIVNDYVLIRVYDTDTDIGTIMLINILTANIFDKLLLVLLNIKFVNTIKKILIIELNKIL